MKSRRGFGVSSGAVMRLACALDDRPVLNVTLSASRGAEVNGQTNGGRQRVLGTDLRLKARVVRAALDRFGSGTIAHDR